MGHQLRYRHCLLLSCIVVVFSPLNACDRQPTAGWTNAKVPPSIIASGEEWLGVPHGAGRLVVIDPGATGRAEPREIALSIDCYIRGVETLDEQVYVIGVRSRGAIDSPSGLYQVDVGTGRCQLIASSSALGGTPRQFLGDESSGRLFVLCNDRFSIIEPLRVVDSERVVNTTLVPSSYSWEIMHSNRLVGVDANGDVILFDPESAELKPLPVPERIDALVEVVSKDRLVFRSAQSVGVCEISLEDSATVTLLPGQFSRWLTTAFEINDKSIVLVEAFEIPYATYWTLGPDRLVTPGENVFDVERITE